MTSQEVPLCMPSEWDRYCCRGERRRDVQVERHSTQPHCTVHSFEMFVIK